MRCEACMHARKRAREPAGLAGCMRAATDGDDAAWPWRYGLAVTAAQHRPAVWRCRDICGTAAR